MTPFRWLRAGLLAGLAVLPSLAVLGSEIVLRPSDYIQLKIAGVPVNDVNRVTGEYMIDGQGYVNMPNLGRIKIAGLSISAAESIIETGYRSHDIYTRPTIVINMAALRRWVNVAGDVKNPQRILYNPKLTVLTSIIIAGGFSPDADEQKVRLLRADVVMTIDLKKIRADPSLDIPVEPGDRIEVPASASKTTVPLVGGRE